MHTSRFAAGIVAIATSTMLLLSGCAEERKAPPSGLTETELNSYRDLVDEQTWLYSGLASEFTQPVVDRVTLNLSDWSEALELCEQSLDTVTDEMQVLLEEYTCRATYQLSAGDLALLNTAQLDYLYDYYQDTLIPCLGLRNLEPAAVPSRKEAVDVAQFGSYPWNPYHELFDYGVGLAAPDQLLETCPAFPPDGIFDRFRNQL